MSGADRVSRFGRVVGEPRPSGWLDTERACHPQIQRPRWNESAHTDLSGAELAAALPSGPPAELAHQAQGRGLGADELEVETRPDGM